MKNADKLIHSFNDTVAQGNFNGLTKREYFAGLAMQGLLKTKSVVVAAKMAVSSADALLEELEKTQR